MLLAGKFHDQLVRDLKGNARAYSALNPVRFANSQCHYGLADLVTNMATWLLTRKQLKWPPPRRQV